MSPTHPLLVACLAVVCAADTADAQIVRRFAGGGVQVNAPLVRVNVSPYGATSVRAPFTAVDSPGRTYVGRRRRFLAQPRYAPPTRSAAPRKTKPIAQEAAKVPERANVDALPYPTTEQLAEMENAELVETLRQMMARLQYRLSLLETGKGWQEYLVLSREILGSPGSPPTTANIGAIHEILPRYRSVRSDPQFQKIAGLPSFGATLAAMEETTRRFADAEHQDSQHRLQDGPQITNPNSDRSTDGGTHEAAPNKTPRQNVPAEVLPSPGPTLVPNAKRGERSILKRR